MAHVALFGSSACSSDLGECNEQEAQQLVYSRSGFVATKGQALMHDSCGQGAFCHSSAAKGVARRGAPGDMNFDVLPEPRSLSKIVELRDQIWHQVQSGLMPPSDFQVGDSDWVFDMDRRPGSAKLPPLSSEAGLGALRNWLSCKAPSVGKTKVPAWAVAAPPAFDLQATRWTRLYGQLKTDCVNEACHDAERDDAAVTMSSALAQTPFNASECGVYRWLLYTRDACGQRLVVGGDPDSSALVHKLEDDAPACGDPMPLDRKRNAGLVDLARDWVAQGAWAPQCGEYSEQAPRVETDASVASVAWSDVYTEIIAPSCATANCHDAASAKLSGELDLSSACDARKALLEQEGPCGKRVVAGDTSSTLIDKISSDTPRCKSRMPVGLPLSRTQIERIRSWVEQGAEGAGCE